MNVWLEVKAWWFILVYIRVHSAVITHVNTQRQTTGGSQINTHDEHMMNTWRTHDEHMMNTWRTHDAYMMNTWRTHDEHMMHTWWTHDEHMMNTWRTHDAYMMNTWWTHDAYMMTQLWIHDEYTILTTASLWASEVVESERRRKGFGPHAENYNNSSATAEVLLTFIFASIFILLGS